MASPLTSVLSGASSSNNDDDNDADHHHHHDSGTGENGSVEQLRKDKVASLMRPKLVESIKDVASVYDFEQLSKAARKDSLPPSVVRFPKDDVVIEVQHRHRHTVDMPPVLAESSQQAASSSSSSQAEDLPLYVQKCFDFWSSEWCVLKRNYADLGSGPVGEPMAPAKLPDRLFELEVVADDAVEGGGSSAAAAAAASTAASRREDKGNADAEALAESDAAAPENIPEEVRLSVKNLFARQGTRANLQVVSRRRSSSNVPKPDLESTDTLRVDLLEENSSDSQRKAVRQKGRTGLFHMQPGSGSSAAAATVSATASAAAASSLVQGDELEPTEEQHDERTREFLLRGGKNLLAAPPSKLVLVEPVELSFDLGDFQPFWCTLAAYDLNKRQRVSENFSFALNTFFSNKMLGVGVEQLVHQNKHALLRFTSASPDIFLVLRIEKILQGDIDEVCEPYLKGNQCKERARHKLSDVISDISSRLTAYRQPFAWSMLPLFVDGSGELLSPGECSFTPIYRAKGDLSDDGLMQSIDGAVSSQARSGSRRLKVIKGRLKVNLTAVASLAATDAIRAGARLVSPSNLAVNRSATNAPSKKSKSKKSKPKGKSSSTGDGDGPIVRELQEFPAEPAFVPHLDYVNTLYVYPESVAMSKSDNYMVRMHVLENDDVGALDPKAIEALPIIYEPMTLSLASSASSYTQCRSKSPAFYSEFKVQLPPRLTPNHHLLFVFFRVRVKPPKKNQPSSPETPVGFAFVPVLEKNRFADRELELPIASELPSHYLSLPATAIRFIDGGKPLFKVTLNLMSTVYSQDQALSTALTLMCPPDAQGTDNLKNKQSLQALTNVPPLATIQFFPAIMDHLLALICVNDELAADALRALVGVAHLLLVDNAKTPRLLDSYARYVHRPNAQPATLYPHLIRRWLETLLGANGGNDQLILFAPFLFSLIFKSMVACASGRSSAAGKPTLSRLKAVAELRNLVLTLAYEAQMRSATGVVAGKDLIIGLAMFLRDLFSIMDRGFVLELVNAVVQMLCPRDDDDLTLIDYKFAFLRAVGQYQHFVSLNVPTPLRIASTDDYSRHFQRVHFLSGLVLNEVERYSAHKERAVRLRAISTLQSMLQQHYFDPRYQTQAARSRIVELYFPYLIMLMDRLHMYEKASHAEKRGLLLCFLYVLRNLQPELLRAWWMIEAPLRLARFFEACRMALDVFEYVGEARLMSLMGTDQGAQASGGAKAALEQFYMQSAAGGGPGGLAGGASGASSASSASLSGGSLTQRRFKSLRERRTHGKERFGKLAMAKRGFQFDERREQNLSVECSYAVLDAAEEFVHAFEAQLRAEEPPYLLVSQVFALYTQFLRLNQSTEFLHDLYASLRALIRRFSTLIFRSRTSTFVADLVFAVLDHCNCASEQIRSEATVALYLLMSTNYQVLGDGKFTRVKVQATNAVSQLNADDTCLRRSLAAIKTFANKDSVTARSAAKGVSSFTSQVGELMERLYSILEDSQRINEHADNLELKHDLMTRVAKSYAGTPDLRVSWLEKLARDHARHEQWAEAAVVYVHLAALSAEHLRIKEHHQLAILRKQPSKAGPAAGGAAASSSSSSPGKSSGGDASSMRTARTLASEDLPWLPSGIDALRSVSPGVVEERLPREVVLRETDGVCESYTFNGVEGFISTCQKAIYFFHKATLWESVYKVYKLMLPIYEHQRKFTAMSQLFDDLSRSFKKVAGEEEARSRMLGTFYRVGFFGDIFEHDAGVEFVYKTPKLTRLGEIKERLESVMGARYGAKNIEVLPRADPVRADQLQKGKGYIQITLVKPFFELEEEPHHVTYYEQVTNVRRFVFEVPFAKGASKKAHTDSLADQWKRRHVLTVEHQFPYVKCRLRVVATAVHEVSPIEGSIDTMEQQTRIMLAEMEAVVPDAKTLQRVLQGSLLVQVQAGPKAIAQTFFGDDAVKAEQPAELIARLRNAFRAFLKACREAVGLNKLLIRRDQATLQDELEQALSGFEKLLADLHIIPRSEVASLKRYKSLASMKKVAIQASSSSDSAAADAPESPEKPPGLLSTSSSSSMAEE
jgi:C2 domain in Dock180 and Zizimin proteins/DHR-2, Lobe B/DHR-2, Lobe C/DHR-2, Lobe A